MRWSKERALKELVKYSMLCANCHREVHSKAFDSTIIQTYKEFISKKCEYCKQEFKTKDYQQQFCSVECRGKSQRRIKRPSKSELKVLIDHNNWTHLGKMFGVSDNAV